MLLQFWISIPGYDHRISGNELLLTFCDVLVLARDWLLATPAPTDNRQVGPFLTLYCTYSQQASILVKVRVFSIYATLMS
jgi:hypothetical protein